MVRPTPVPPGLTPVAAQGDRVLLEGDDRLRWWTPSTGDVRRIPGWRGLATGQTITVVCDAACRTVDVLAYAGGRVARLRMTEPVTAALVAPGERAIVLLTETETELATAALVIVDRDAEAMQSVTNGVASRLQARGLAWSPDGAWLFFPTTTGRIGVSRARHRPCERGRRRRRSVRRARRGRLPVTGVGPGLTLWEPDPHIGGFAPPEGVGLRP